MEIMTKKVRNAMVVSVKGRMDAISSSEVEKELSELEGKVGYKLRDFSNFFSIEDSLLKKGINYDIDSKGGKIFVNSYWNSEKGVYCKENVIKLHIDDCKEYGYHFESGFHHFTTIDDLVGKLKEEDIIKG